MAIATGCDPRIKAIADALGLPPKLRRFTLTAGVDIATTVHVEYLLESVDAGKLPQLRRESWTLNKENQDGG